MTVPASQDDPLAPLLGRLAEQRDDDDAWRSLYRLLWPFVYASTFRQLHGRRDLAEDASQEVFLRLARYAPFEQLHTPAALRSYVWVTARNVTRTMLKKLAGRKEVPLGQPDDAIAQLVEASEGDASKRAEIRDTLKVLIDAQPLEDAQVLRLLVEGADLKEIAAQTNRSYSDVAVRLHRLRARLRARGMPRGF